ncbi:MAG: hypothetical protein COV70_01895 [Parcubacteria group bacterium CG11_big_fil_rev_8_21_14_0_20_39_22]|nr:MAG: hypothetical protein COV70_01895 [Parcubacteria group bacterium CG11_big_fil_rev_8_21_14_0_20_39_22]
METNTLPPKIRNLRQFFKKTTIIILVVSIIAPSVLFTRPQKADAFLGCLLVGLAGKAGDAVNQATSSFTSVPVFDRANASINSDIKQEQAAQTKKDCFLDFAVKVVGKIMIKTVTKSVVNWINGGFNDSPTFVTNPEGFLGDISDQVIGESIRSLGDIGEILCSPFDLDLRLALNLHYSSTRSDYIGCRLTDIEENIHNAFVGGNFGGKQGWNQWFAMHRSPQNNPYGSFVQLTSDIDTRIQGRHNIELDKLDWGQGFMSWESCPSGDSGGEEAYHERLEGKCTVNTPGSVIEGQLQEVLPAELRELEFADEINEILSAVVNFALTKVMSSTGLLGSSQSPSGGGGSYFDGYVSEDSQSEFNRQLAVASATKPANISLTCTEFRRDSYSVNGDGTVLVGVYDSTNNRFGEPVEAIDNNNAPWSQDNLSSMQLYCRNSEINQFAEDQAPGFVPDDFGFSSGEGEQPRRKNLALNKPTVQSSTYSDFQVYTSGLAVDSTEQTTAITNEGLGWWQVDLTRDSFGNLYEIENIEEIEFVPRPNLPNQSSFVTILLSTEPFAIDETYSQTIQNNTGIVETIHIGNISYPQTFKIGRKASYIKIFKRRYGYLSIAEVKVFGTEVNQNQSSQGSDNGDTVVPLSVSIGIDSNEDNTYSGNDEGTIELSISPDQDANNLLVTFSLQKEGTNTVINNILSPLEVWLTKDGVQEFSQTYSSITSPNPVNIPDTFSFSKDSDNVLHYGFTVKETVVLGEYNLITSIRNEEGKEISRNESRLTIEN